MFRSLDPRTTTALIPLAPITPPMPIRLALERPCSTEAKNTRFSPASPIAAACALGSPSSRRIASTHSFEPMPDRCAASRISTLSLWTHR